jgi:ribonucleoside-diphosphate reductase alpha chain
VFIDTINEENPFDLARFPEHRIAATNPCGEQPLESFEACNLGSINVDKFLDKSWGIDTPRLRDTVFCAVEFLDDVVDSCDFPLEAITDKVHSNRKIGLGVMGFADMLIRRHIRYGSEESIVTAEELMDFIQQCAWEKSAELAESRGAFPTLDETKAIAPVRNAAVTCIAPTGTLSMLAGCSGGIEPVFALAQTKTVMDGEKFYTIHPGIKELAEKLTPFFHLCFNIILKTNLH